jgi:hypothetical protein
LVSYVTPSYSIVEYTIKARIKVFLKRYNPRAVAYIFMEASVLFPDWTAYLKKWDFALFTFLTPIAIANGKVVANWKR